MENSVSISPVTLDGGDGYDRMENRRGGHKALILGGKGNDQIWNGEYNHGNNYATIDCGAGDDTVSNYGKNSSIVGGAGNDSIRHVGANSTVRGGDGNDWINNDDGERDYGHNNTISSNKRRPPADC